MIIVTGGAGFIGSNLVKGLNDRGITDILVVDNLTNADKFKNLCALKFNDFIDKSVFIKKIKKNKLDKMKITTIMHQGACSDTMEYNGKYMMENNFEYSKTLLHYSLQRKIDFIYASSASTYGNGSYGFSEQAECEDALNVYAYSKLFFDRYVKRYLQDNSSQIVGLKYFNVYGPQEHHKQKMASVAYQFYNQIKATGKLKLFAGIDDYANGEQKRDFIYVKDVAKVNFFFMDNPQISGIFNCGTGTANSFNTIAKAVIEHHGSGEIEYIPFPENLRGKYQNFTKADTSKLISVGYSGSFTPIKKAVQEYCQMLDESDGYYR